LKFSQFASSLRFSQIRFFISLIWLSSPLSLFAPTIQALKPAHERLALTSFEPILRSILLVRHSVRFAHRMVPNPQFSLSPSLSSSQPAPSNFPFLFSTSISAFPSQTLPRLRILRRAGKFSLLDCVMLSALCFSPIALRPMPLAPCSLPFLPFSQALSLPCEIHEVMRSYFTGSLSPLVTQSLRLPDTQSQVTSSPST